MEPARRHSAPTGHAATGFGGGVAAVAWRRRRWLVVVVAAVRRLS